MIGVNDMIYKTKGVKTYDQFVCEATKRDTEKWDEIKFHADIVARIVIERSKRGISQEQLAQLTGLKQSAIARIESCNCVPKITTLQKILMQLGLTLDVKRNHQVYASKGKVLPIYNYYDYSPEGVDTDEIKWVKRKTDQAVTYGLNYIEECG